MGESNKKYLKMELSSPGKIILFGEHSVVYGKKAVAATLGVYTRLSLSENSTGSVRLQFPPVDLDETISLAAIHDTFAPEDTYENTLEKFERLYPKNGPKALSQNQRNSLLTFFQCFPLAGWSSGFDICVVTDLPIGSGAGSSASYSVIMATAGLILDLSISKKLNDQITRHEDNSITISENFRELISKKAFTCERFFHGTPSGLDHTVILNGSFVEFVKSESNMVKNLEAGLMKVLLVNTKVSRSTRRQVEKVRALFDNYPNVVAPIFDAMGNLADEACVALKELKNKSEAITASENILAGLITLNQSLLKCIGVSHESLEKVCEIAGKHKLNAKLTGAGGGGFAFVYIQSQTPENTVSALKQELTLAGFEVSEAVLGGPGVRIHTLAI